MRNFRKLRVWEESIDFVVYVFKLLNKIPNPYRQIFQSQLLRASISIPANIAEGCSRSSEKDFKIFLEISLGSSFEVETFLIVFQKLELINADNYNESILPLEAIQKMINALIQRIKTDNKIK